MAYFAITEEGKNFIHHVCDNTGMSHLIGNNKVMPYTYPPINKIWTSNALYPHTATTNTHLFNNVPTKNKRKIANGIELAEAIIFWYDTYAKLYELDANVLAAQAYAESAYTLWTYAGLSYDKNNPKLPSASQSSASGLNQILSTTAFSLIVANGGRNNNNPHPFTTEEIAKITKDITDSNVKTSYQVGAYVDGVPPSQHQTGWTNRPIYHQNAIDNPDIMIKAQCAYIKYIADKCNSLASSTIMCYYQGEYERKSYPETIAAVQAGGPGSQGASDGLFYILKIFGVLGDKYNSLVGKGLGANYKPSGFYFGYDNLMDGINIAKNLKLNDPYIGFNTTLG